MNHKWTKKEIQEILSKPFEIFPEPSDEMKRKGIPRGPFPWQFPIPYYWFDLNKRLSDPRLHSHATDYVLLYGGSGGGKTSMSAALGLWFLINFPGCQIIVGANKYKDLEKNVIHKYYKPLLSINKDWDHPWVKTKPNEHNKRLELEIEVSPGVFKTSIAHFMHFADWERLRGLECSYLHFEEISQMEDARALEELTRRLRSSVTPFIQIVCTTNPPESTSHWLYDKWDMSPYIKDYQGDKPEPKLCKCYFCQECLNNNRGEFPYDENNFCTNPDCAFIDELKKINANLAADKKIPITPYPRPLIKFPADENPCFCPGDQSFWRVFLSSSKDNYSLPAQAMQDIKTSHDAVNFRHYVEGEPGSLRANKAYSSYTRSNCLYDEKQLDFKKDIHWTHDHNVRPRCSVVIQEHLTKLDSGEEEICPFIIDEFVIYDTVVPLVDNKGERIKGCGPEDQALAFIEKYKDWNNYGIEIKDQKTVYLHGDHTALNRKNSPTQKSEFQIFVDMLTEANFKVICTVVKVKGKTQINVVDRVTCTNWLLRDYKGNRRVFINSRCKHVLKSFEDMEWLKSTSELDKRKWDDLAAATTDTNRVHLISHVTDAIGYYLARRWEKKLNGNNEFTFAYIPGFPLLDYSSGIAKELFEKKEPSKPLTIQQIVDKNTVPLMEYLKQLNEEYEDDNDFGSYFSPW